MHKAIALRVDLWIEGEDAPEHNFAESTERAVSDIIAAGISSHPELTVKIKDIVEEKDADEGQST